MLYWGKEGKRAVNFSKLSCLICLNLDSGLTWFLPFYVIKLFTCILLLIGLCSVFTLLLSVQNVMWFQLIIRVNRDTFYNLENFKNWYKVLFDIFSWIYSEYWALSNNYMLIIEKNWLTFYDWLLPTLPTVNCDYKMKIAARSTGTPSPLLDVHLSIHIS